MHHPLIIAKKNAPSFFGYVKKQIKERIRGY